MDQHWLEVYQKKDLVEALGGVGFWSGRSGSQLGERVREGEGEQFVGFRKSPPLPCQPLMRGKTGAGGKLQSPTKTFHPSLNFGRGQQNMCSR